MDPMKPSPGKEKDPPSNTASKGKEKQSSAESYGRQLSSSIIPSWPSGRPRSRPQQETISSQDGTMHPSGQHRSGDSGWGGPGRRGLLGPYPNPWQQWIPPFMPPKKRVLKSPQLYEQSGSGLRNNWMQFRKTPQIQLKRTSWTPPPLSPPKTLGSKSRGMISKSGQPTSEDSIVIADMGSHKNSGQSLKMTQLQPNKRPGLGFQKKTTLAQPLHKDSNGDVIVGPNNNSRELVKKPQVQPNKTSASSSLSSPQNMGIKSQATNTMLALPPLNGSDGDVSMRLNDNYSRQPMKTLELQPKKSPGPQYHSPPNIGLISNVMIASSAQPYHKCSNVDVSRRQSDSKDDCLITLMSGWKSTKKRLHGTNTLANIEEVGNVTMKKNRLTWGEGLAKYEKEKREQDLINTPTLGVSGDLSNSSTNTTEMVAIPGIVPTFSCGSSPSHAAISATSDRGNSNLPLVIGAHSDPNNNHSSMNEKAICRAASSSNPPQGVYGDPGISSTWTTETVACPNIVPGVTSDILGTSKNMTEVMVYSSDLGNSSKRTTEMVACPDIIPGANSDLDNNSSSMTKKEVCPQGVCDDHVNSTTEKVVCPAASGCNLPQVVGGSDDPGNSRTDMIQMIAREVALLFSHRCNASQGAKCDILSTSTSVTEVKVCLDDVSSFTHACPPPQAAGENNNLANRSMSVIEIVVCPATVPASDRTGGSFATSTMIQDVPHKLTAHGSNKTHSSSAPPQGTVLAGEIIAPPHHGTSSAITTSNPDFSLTSPKIQGPDLRNLNENRSSDDKIKRDVSSATSAIVEDTPYKLISQGNDKIESSSAALQRIFLAGEMIAPSHQGPSSPITTANTGFSLTIPKVEELELRNFSENRSSDEEMKKDEQEWKSGTNGISACKNSTNCITQSCSKLDGDELHTSINADCGNGESTTDGKQNSNPELYAASNESNDGKMLSKKEHPKSDRKCGIVNNGSELGGNGPVQQHNDTVEMEIDTNDNDNNRDENPQHCVVQGKISGTVSSCMADSMDVEKNDTIQIPEGNEIIEPQQQISNEAPRICQLSSSSGPSALQTVNAKSSDVKFDVDLNIPLDVDLVDLYSSRRGASIGINASRQTTQIDLNIPDPTSLDDVSAARGPANFNLGAKVEMAHDFTHVLNYLQSQAKMPEIKKDPVNQPGCFVLFGKVIFEAPSSQRKHTSMQDNKIHGCSRGMTSNMTVPFTPRDGRSYPSGPCWSSTWSRVPIDPYHQSMFASQMPYGSVSGSTAWPFQSGRSAFVNWRQIPQLNLTPHSMMRGGLPYHMGLRSRTSSLLNFDPSFPNTNGPQAPGSFAPASRPQAPGPITPSRTNGEGSSISNTRKGKEKIG